MADAEKTAQEALRLTVKLAEQLGRVEERLKVLEKALREPRGPKAKPETLTEEEWLAQRRLVMAENAKHRWAKKRKAEAAGKPAPSPAPKKRKAAKR